MSFSFIHCVCDLSDVHLLPTTAINKTLLKHFLCSDCQSFNIALLLIKRAIIILLMNTAKIASVDAAAQVVLNALQHGTAFQKI